MTKWKKRLTAIAGGLALLGGTAFAIPALMGSAQAEGTGKTITRSEVVARAHYWLQRNVSYNQGGYTNGPGESRKYRQDCSGFVSMAWHLKGSEWTGSLGKYSHKIKYGSLKAGDILMRNPQSTAGHVVMFERWANKSKTKFWIIEQASRASDMNYRVVSVSERRASGYTAYRYDKIRDDNGKGVEANDSTSGAKCRKESLGTIDLRGRRDVYVETRTCLKYDKSAKRLRAYIITSWGPGRDGDDSRNTSKKRFDGFAVHTQIEKDEKPLREVRCSLYSEVNKAIKGSKSCAVQIASKGGKWSSDGYVEWNENADGKYWMGPAYRHGSPYIRI